MSSGFSHHFWDYKKVSFCPLCKRITLEASMAENVIGLKYGRKCGSVHTQNSQDIVWWQCLQWWYAVMFYQQKWDGRQSNGCELQRYQPGSKKNTHIFSDENVDNWKGGPLIQLPKILSSRCRRSNSLIEVVWLILWNAFSQSDSVACWHWSPALGFCPARADFFIWASPVLDLLVQPAQGQEQMSVIDHRWYPTMCKRCTSNILCYYVCYQKMRSSLTSSDHNRLDQASFPAFLGREKGSEGARVTCQIETIYVSYIQLLKGK